MLSRFINRTHPVDLVRLSLAFAIVMGLIAERLP